MNVKKINVTKRLFILIYSFIFVFFMFFMSCNPVKAYEKLSSPITVTGGTGGQSENLTTEDSNGGPSDLNNLEITYTDGNLSTNLENGDSENTWNKIFKQYKGVIAGISGIMMLTFIVFFLINLGKIGASGSNATARKDATIGLIWTGVAAAASGSVLVITALFWNALK